MKNKILTLLAEREKIILTELPDLMPEIKGEWSIYMPVKKGCNPNMLWLAGVNEDFITAFNELLITEQLIDWNPISAIDVMFEHKTMYVMDLATPKLSKSTKHCWMPISINLMKKN